MIYVQDFVRTTVVDLGSDVPPERFIQAAQDEHASVICCSALLTTTMVDLDDAESFEVPTHIPGPSEGRIPLCTEAMRRMKAAVGEKTALYGLITGPLTLASHLRGTELFMDLILQPEKAHALLTYCLDVAKAVAGYYVQAGMDVIAVVDPMVSQISPDHFEEFLSPVYTRLFDHIRSLNVLSSFFVCGNATRNIEPMCKTKPDGISVDENVDLVAAKNY